MDVSKKVSLVKVMAAILFVLGVIGFFIIGFTFDYEYYNQLKEYSSNQEELDALKLELIYNWARAIGVLMSSIAIGTVLWTLGRIVNMLQEIKEGMRQEPNKESQS